MRNPGQIVITTFPDRETLEKSGMPPVKSLVPNLCNGNVFDEYLHASGNRNFYERFQKGENVKAGWITPTDIEQERIVE